jgi:thiol-disulfide isomerase/thioredoxin
MTKKILSFFMNILIVLAIAAIGFAQSSVPKIGGILPDMELVKSKDSADHKYLGLSSGGNIFKIKQIKSKIVIIEIFSMYCPYCQAEAPNINKLNQLIENNPAYKDKIKIIGIGAGNTPFEVGTFKRKYTIAFPLVPDGDFKLHKLLGETRTPYFIVVKLNGDNPPEVIYSKLGAIAKIDLFLSQIAKLSGL